LSQLTVEVVRNEIRPDSFRFNGRLFPVKLDKFFPLQHAVIGLIVILEQLGDSGIIGGDSLIIGGVLNEINAGVISHVALRGRESIEPGLENPPCFRHQVFVFVHQTYFVYYCHGLLVSCQLLETLQLEISQELDVVIITECFLFGI
jgi:hypothetical protein